MKKLFGVCLFSAIISLTSVGYASGTMEATLSCDEYGHIFTEKDQTFQISVQSSLTETFNGKIEYNIISDGEVISSKEENITITPNGSYTNYPTLDCPKYGIFTLEATVTDGSTDYETVTMPFSYINASDEDELNSRMHVNTHMEVYDNRAETVEAVKNAGFGGIRNPIYWFQVETNNKNEYKMPAHAQAIMDACDAGLDPIILLSGGNGPWGVTNTAGGNLNMAPSTTEQINAFANYCAYVANHFKGKVKYYEIWNEFTMDGSNAGDKSGAAYAKILAAAAKAIKAVDPNAKVVGMSTAYIDNTFISNAVTALKNSGNNHCYDIASVHPYDHNTRWGTPRIISLVNTTKNITGKPVWFTERGWSTYTGEHGVSEKVQAVNAVDDYLVFLANNSCDRMYWYDFQNDGLNSAEMEHNFGLIRSVDAEIPGEAKPAYVAMAAMNKLLSKATYKQVNTYTGGNLYSFTDAEGENLFALSGSVGSKPTVITGAGKYELLDMYSNVVEVYNSTGNIRFTQTDEIMYIRKHYEPASCSVTLTDGQLQVSGYSMESNQQVSFMVSDVAGEIIYAGQTTCDSERAFGFTANAKGVNELYIKVNYGEVYDTEIETGFVLKLMCDGKRILSVKDITANGDVKLVVSVNEEIKEKTDVYGAVYSGNSIKYTNKITLNPGDTGDHDIVIDLSGITQFDKISGFVWKDMDPLTSGVYFR